MTLPGRNKRGTSSVMFNFCRPLATHFRTVSEELWLLFFTVSITIIGLVAVACVSLVCAVVRAMGYSLVLCAAWWSRTSPRNKNNVMRHVNEDKVHDDDPYQIIRDRTSIGVDNSQDTKLMTL